MNEPITVLGDLNCNVLKENPEREALSNFFSENLKQIITTPTRITDTCEPLIDFILVSSPDLVHARGVTNTPISDHLPVYVELKLNHHHVISQHGVTSIITPVCLLLTKFFSIFSEEEIHFKLATFNVTFLSTLDAHAPIKLIRIRSHTKITLDLWGK